MRYHSVMIVLAALLSAPCNAHPQYAVVPVVSHVRIVRRPAGYLATAHLHFTLRVSEPAMLPSVGDPGLLQHVQGHLVVARRAVVSSDANIDANGASAAQARARLNRTVARMRSDLQNELAREEQAYENVTNYGKSQSQGPSYGFPGGSDVQSPCVK